MYLIWEYLACVKPLEVVLWPSNMNVPTSARISKSVDHIIHPS